MKRIVGYVMGTVGVVFALALLLGASKLIALVPVGTIWAFVQGHWKAMLLMSVVNLMGAIIGEIFTGKMCGKKSKKRKRNHKDDDDEDEEEED